MSFSKSDETTALLRQKQATNGEDSSHMFAEYYYFDSVYRGIINLILNDLNLSNNLKVI